MYLNRYMTSPSIVFSHRPLCLLAAILLWLPSCETLDRYDITMNDVPVYQAASVATVTGVDGGSVGGSKVHVVRVVGRCDDSSR